MIERIFGRKPSGGTKTSVAAVAAALALVASAAAASSGSGFAGARSAAIDFPTSARAATFLQQPDGKVVAVGTTDSSAFALARYDADKTLDPSYGDGGLVVTPVGPLAGSPSAAPQPDGSLVVTGAVDGAPGEVVAVRYLPDGSLDPSFGDGGILRGASSASAGASAPSTTSTSGVGATAQPLTNPDPLGIAEDFPVEFKPAAAEPLALAVEPGEGILAAGSASVGGTPDAALAELSATGAPNGAFGDDGRAVHPFGEGLSPAIPAAASVTGDGKVLIAGETSATTATPGGFVLSRYGTDGSLDESFGDNGVATTSLPGAVRATAVAAQPDGKAVLAGTLRRAGRTSVVLARYERDGALDPSFGHGGTAVLPASVHEARGVAIERGGRIIVAGGGFNLAGLTPSGRPDRSFGRGGRVHTRLAGGSAADGILASGGDLVLYGESAGRLALAAYRADGSRDRSFGRNGNVVSSIPDFAAGTAHATLEPHRQIVLAGSRHGRFAVARFDADGSLDRGFGAGGEMTSSVAGTVGAVVAGPNQILVAGSPATGDTGRFVLARFDGASTARSPAPAPHPAAQPRRPHRLGPPNPVPAWYVNAANFKELKQFAAQDACKFARTQPKTAKRTLILDFGGARAYPDGSFGAAVNNATFEATNQQIRAALNTAADGYAACHKRGRATIAYANTNHFDVQSVAVKARQIGVHQAATVAHVSDYLHKAGYAPAVRAGVAGDIEMGYWGPSKSKAMVNGAKSIRERGYMDFGTAGGCPPYLKGQRRPRHHKCLNDWTLDDVAHVSNSGGGEPLPEIYYRGGRFHYDQAAQWARVARRWNSEHATPFIFFGATGSTEFSGLTPGESWKRLKRKTSGHVGRELVNFRQDHFKPVPAAKGPDAQPH